MGLWDQVGDWVERRAQANAYGANFTAYMRQRLEEEKVRVVRERAQEIIEAKPSIPVLEAQAKAAVQVQQLLSDQYRPNLLFDPAEFFRSVGAGFSTQEFLTKKKCFLAAWRDPETGAWASDLIDLACARAGLDPRVILISLQREQSAIGAQTPLPERKVARILGYGCMDPAKAGGKGEDIVKYYGFGNQIKAAADGYVRFASRHKQGATIRVDYGAAEVTPLNPPTTAYYIYTPHIIAGKVSFLIGRSFFGF